jgi:hypothetical protein
MTVESVDMTELLLDNFEFLLSDPGASKNISVAFV